MNWKLDEIYKNIGEWEQDLALVKSKIPEIQKAKGTLLVEDTNSLFELLEVDLFLDSVLDKLSSYAFLYKDTHLNDDLGFELLSKIETASIEIGSSFSFFNSEILSFGEEKFFSLISSDSRLDRFHKMFHDLFRSASHILSSEQEEILSKTGVLFNSGDVFEAINEIDLSFEDVVLENGEHAELNHATFSTFLEHPNQAIRQQAFQKVYAEYEKFNSTIAASYIARLKEYEFSRSIRNYNDSLERSLFSDNIPNDVYLNLISTVRKHLPSFYKYADVKRRALNLDSIHLYDFYAPTTSIDSVIPFDSAFAQVKKSLSILGEDYVSILEEAVTKNWVDVFPSDDKTSGAYSFGPYHLEHPYVLLNQTDDYNSLFTMAHEFGHMMHSYYSNKNCDPLYADYSIFVAEVASTVNEVLMMLDMLENATDVTLKKHLIADFLDKFKSTLFRQTLFAEFELKAHTLVFEKQPVTKSTLNDLYYKINKDYFGDDVIVDSEIQFEWSRIPHFYRPFYVFKYATSFASAIDIATKIHNGDEDTLKAYRHFLTMGGTEDPIDELKTVGVDLSTPAVIDNALEFFAQLTNQFEQLL